jgi:hypothetical protein
MSFNENAFMIAGTAIAILGVGLYIWDTRGDSFKSAAAQGYSRIQSYNQPRYGGSRRRRSNNHKKTKRH